jgi:hypothetical protein
MLLQEAYGYPAFGTLILNPYEDRSIFFEKWKTWRLASFHPEHIKKDSGMSIDDTKAWYQELAILANINDPLANWFVLLQLINRAKKEKLKKDALLSQEYYKLARMVAFFIYDLTTEKMFDPDDVIDEQKGKWKREKYGEPFDYETKTIQHKILDNFLIDRPYMMALVYEGDTEDGVIKMIFDALYVDPERDGLFLYNAEGQGNVERNLYGLAELARKNEMDIFLILDRDARWSRIILDFKNYGYIKEGKCHVWNKDFESDNFAINETLDKVNYILSEKCLKIIKKEELEEKMSNPNIFLRKAISDLIYKENGKALNDIISNKELGRLLIQSRIEKIKMERDGDGWKPLLPIEKVLNNIFHLIPRFIG